MMQHKLAIALVTLSLPAFAALPARVPLAKDATVEFLAIGKPSAVKIRGTAQAGKPALDGALVIEAGQLSGDAVCQLDAFQTGIGLRDDHMKNKYLEVPKYPTATLKIAPTALPAEVVAGRGEGKVDFKGMLTLHGKTNEVIGSLETKATADEFTTKFSFPLALEQYGIEVPNYLGIKVTDKVVVTVESKTRVGTLQ